MATVTLSLPDELWAKVEQRLRTNSWSPDEYFAALIRWDWDSSDGLEQAIQEGEESGLSDRSFDEIIAEARQRFRSEDR